VGSLVTVMGFGYGAYSVIRKLIFQDTVNGWTSLTVLVAIFSGFIMISLGLIGEYVGRIYEEIKQRPLYLVRRSYNTSLHFHGYRIAQKPSHPEHR
jgi:hypothetical protein